MACMDGHLVIKGKLELVVVSMVRLYFGLAHEAGKRRSTRACRASGPLGSAPMGEVPDIAGSGAAAAEEAGVEAALATRALLLAATALPEADAGAAEVEAEATATGASAAA